MQRVLDMTGTVALVVVAAVVSWNFIGQKPQNQRSLETRPELIETVDITVSDLPGFKLPPVPKQSGPLIIEVVDYECPYCRQFASQVMPKLALARQDFQFVTIDLPIPFHPKSKEAAIAAHCAGEQAKFKEMHDALFA